MLCQRCHRPAVVAARQVNRQASGWQSAVSPLHGGFRIRSQSLAQRTPAARVRYSTSTGSAAASPSDPAASAAPEKPDYLDDAESAIWDKLAAEFSPTELMVRDISGGCGSMYGIEIASEKFRGVNMLKQQRMVNSVLGDQMKGWHGVQLRTKLPT